MPGFLRLLINESRHVYSAGKTAGGAAADANIGMYAAWGNPERFPAVGARLYAGWNSTLSADADLDAQGAAPAERTGAWR